MKNQALFSSKDICKKLKCCLLQFLFGTLRDNSDKTLFGKKYHNCPKYWQSLTLIIRYMITTADETAKGVDLGQIP